MLPINIRIIPPNEAGIRCGKVKGRSIFIAG